MKLTDTIDDFNGNPHRIDNADLTLGALLQLVLERQAGSEGARLFQAHGLAYKIWQATTEGTEIEFSDSERQLCRVALLAAGQLPAAVRVPALREMGYEPPP